MRIQKELIDRIAKKIVKSLIDNNFLIWEERPELLESIINEIITEDLMVEDRLNDEVKTLLEARTQEINEQ